LPHRNLNGRGDQLVEVKVAVPKRVSSRATELLEELAEEIGEPIPEDTLPATIEPSKTFMDKLKGFFG
jgi:DnaJ-class molecular chaperone